MTRKPASGIAGRRMLRAMALLSIGIAAPMPAIAANLEPYHVSSGDVLSVVSYGNAGLSGTFPISANGTIGYPMLGTVSVAGKTTTEIGDMLTQALARHIPGATATVTVSSFAPVFILGDVSKPGSYPYHPGMITLELFALGGGAPRLSATADPTGMQFIAQRQQYAELSIKLFSLAVKEQRLRAEQTDTEFEFPLPADTDATNRDLRQRIITAETNIYRTRRHSFEAEKEALVNQQASYDQEIDALHQSIKLHSQELALLEQDVASTKALADRGLTAQTNYRAAQRELSQTRRDALELESFLARANQNKLDLALRRQMLIDNRTNAIAEELRATDLEIALAKRSLEAVLASLGELGVMAASADDVPLKQNTSFTITRNVGGSYTEIAADERTEIRPGDILRATITLPKSRVTVPATLSLN